MVIGAGEVSGDFRRGLPGTAEEVSAGRSRKGEGNGEGSGSRCGLGGECDRPGFGLSLGPPCPDGKSYRSEDLLARIP